MPNNDHYCYLIVLHKLFEQYNKKWTENYKKIKKNIKKILKISIKLIINKQHNNSATIYIKHSKIIIKLNWLFYLIIILFLPKNKL